MQSERLLNEDGTGTSIRNSQNGALSHLKQNALLYAIITGVVIGAVVGVILSKYSLSNEALDVVGIIGELFLNVLQLIVAPLVFLSMTSGVCSLGKSRSGVSKVASVTILYYTLTTLSAVILGVILINIIKPGKYQPFKTDDTSISEDTFSNDDTILEAILDIFRSVFPSNIVVAIMESNILGIITISISIGLALNAQGEASRPIIEMIETLNNVIITIVHWILYCAPFGIASIVAHNIAVNPNFIDILVSLALFVSTIATGLVIHSFVILPLWFFYFTRENSFKYAKYFVPAWTTAFGTASSLATLPINLDCALNAGVSLNIAELI